jgi:hypothetical protein
MANKTYSTTTFSIPFSNFSVSSTGGATAFDLWSVKASSLGRVELKEINIGQLSTSVQGNQQLNVQVFRGSTALAGGATVTPCQLKGLATAPTALSSATAPSSNLASTASATLVLADCSDYSGNWFYRPDDFEEIVLDTSQGLNVRIGAPPVTVQLSGSLIFKEITKLK